MVNFFVKKRLLEAYIYVKLKKRKWKFLVLAKNKQFIPKKIYASIVKLKLSEKTQFRTNSQKIYLFLYKMSFESWILIETSVSSSRRWCFKRSAIKQDTIFLMSRFWCVPMKLSMWLRRSTNKSGCISCTLLQIWTHTFSIKFFSSSGFDPFDMISMKTSSEILIIFKRRLKGCSYCCSWK